VGGTLWAATAGLIAWSARRVRLEARENRVPMMGVLGAFIFTAQMINFAIPGTGSSGHLGGGLILAVLLGPHAAFLTIASVLTIQALFFADGGLLALGCNIFNLGFFPAFLAWPLLYRPLAGDGSKPARAWAAAMIAAVAGLQLGAFSVVLETRASGLSELPFGTFVVLMQPIHLAIGVVEGLATAAVVAFIARARPEVLSGSPREADSRRGLRPVLVGLLIAAAVIGGGLSWFASAHPDGLEWAMARVTGRPEIEGAGSSSHRTLAAVQEKTAFLPDYGFKAAETGAGTESTAHSGSEPWPAVSAGTSLSGLVGGALTLLLAGLIGFGLRAWGGRHEPAKMG
jgi:cobalt/nickel transport system permease protein